MWRSIIDIKGGFSHQRLLFQENTNTSISLLHQKFIYLTYLKTALDFFSSTCSFSWSSGKCWPRIDRIFKEIVTDFMLKKKRKINFFMIECRLIINI
jgi:hypothetical protein